MTASENRVSVTSGGTNYGQSCPGLAKNPADQKIQITPPEQVKITSETKESERCPGLKPCSGLCMGGYIRSPR